MKTLKIYNLIREVREDLKRLVDPVVIQDIRSERGKLQEAMELLEEFEETDK